MATRIRVKARAAQANSTREVARVSSPRQSMFGMADLTRNVKEAARETLKRDANHDWALPAPPDWCTNTLGPGATGRNAAAETTACGSAQEVSKTPRRAGAHRFSD